MKILEGNVFAQGFLKIPVQEIRAKRGSILSPFQIPPVCNYKSNFYL